MEKWQCKRAVNGVKNHRIFTNINPNNMDVRKKWRENENNQNKNCAKHITIPFFFPQPLENFRIITKPKRIRNDQFVSFHFITFHRWQAEKNGAHFSWQKCKPIPFHINDFARVGDPKLSDSVTFFSFDVQQIRCCGVLHMQSIISVKMCTRIASSSFFLCMCIYEDKKKITTKSKRKQQ